MPTTRVKAAATASPPVRRRRRRMPKPCEGELPFPNGHGGWRPRPKRRSGKRGRVPHRARVPLASRFPAHVTWTLREGLPSLRKAREYRVVQGAFVEGCERFGFRLVHYSVQSNHAHLIVEAKDRRAMSRGLQGLAIRVAKRLNKAWDRRGKVFAERYHDRVLRTPREVRNVLAYVLRNATRHGFFSQGLEPRSSGAWFDGWKGREPLARPEPGSSPVARARTWLLRFGWRRHGRIPLDAMPGWT